MLGHFGWILPLEDVDDAVAGKTDGKIYIHKRDIADGSQLAEGDIVGFYLYSDDHGLGAEEARCLEKAAAVSFNAHALEFVPSGGKSPGMNMDAVEFVCDLGSEHERCLKNSAATCFNDEAPEILPSARPWLANPEANEYVPSSVSMNASAMDFVPFGRQAELSNLGRLQSVFAINLAYLSDDSSDDESDLGRGLLFPRARLVRSDPYPQEYLQAQGYQATTRLISPLRLALMSCLRLALKVRSSSRPRASLCRRLHVAWPLKF